MQDLLQMAREPAAAPAMASSPSHQTQHHARRRRCSKPLSEIRPARARSLAHRPMSSSLLRLLSLRRWRLPAPPACKSPPTTTPFRASRNATEKIPSEPVPLWRGVDATCHERQRSIEHSTRAVAAAPVPIQTWLPPQTQTLVPLAAKAPSFSRAGGSCCCGTDASARQRQLS